MVCLNCDPAVKDAQRSSYSSSKTLPIDLFYFMKNKNYINKVYLFCQDLYFFLNSKTIFKVVLTLQRMQD